MKKSILRVMFLLCCILFVGMGKVKATEVAEEPTEPKIMYEGSQGDLHWTLDENKHLKLWGTGDFEGEIEGEPWGSANLKSATETAEVKITGMTNASRLFSQYKKLREIDLSGFDTSNVTDMSYMFYYCSSLTNLDVRYLDTSKVTTMSYMFCKCGSILSLDLSNWKAANLTNISSMFMECTSLTDLNLNGFKTSIINQMSYIFNICTQLEYLDLTDLNLSKVENVQSILSNTYALKFIAVPANINMEIVLPVKGGNYVWVDSNGNEQTGILPGLKTGMCYQLVQKNSEGEIPVIDQITDLLLSEKAVMMKPGEALEIYPIAYPANIPTTYTWMSSDDEVATVEDGKITANKVGIATITVKTDNDKVAKCTVKVLNDNEIVGKDENLQWILEENGTFIVSGNGDFTNGVWKKFASQIKVLDLRKLDVEHTVGLEKLLSLPNLEKIIVPANIARDIPLPEKDTFIWTNDAEEDAGYIIYKNIDKVVTYIKNKYIYADKVTLSAEELSLEIGKSAELTATIIPENVTFKELIWTTSDEKVATVKDGAVTAVAEGEATVTVEKDGKKAECKVMVADPDKDDGDKDDTDKEDPGNDNTDADDTDKDDTDTEEPVVKPVIKLNAKSAPLQKGKSTKALKVEYKSIAGDKIAKWRSSNTKVASVSSKGKIKAKRVGTTTITVTMKSGAKASCKIKVQKGKVKTKKLTLNKKRITLKVRKKITLAVKRNPITATEKLKWTSSNKKIATVNSKGKVTAKKKGTAKITVKTTNGKKATCKVTVKK